MADFYKMEPAAWDFGTASLSLEEEAAYLRIVNAMHKHRAPVPNNDRVLAGLFRVSTRKARALVQALVAAKKVVIEGDEIWNERALSDLVQRGFTGISRAESGAKGGRTRAENAAKALKENNTAQANASSREEKRREENSVAKATGAEAPPDLTKIAFDAGVKVLTEAGKSPSTARAIVGKWRGKHGDEAVIAAVAKAQRERATDPVAFCEGIFRASAKASNGQRRQLPDGTWQSYDPFNGWVTEHV